ncbi:MAG: dTMP kinase [Dehalococcoidales bacterium]|nr:dTMP kinase [Dehalococcoidales bacterium]
MHLFITFEGGEGSGKSLQAKALYRKLCLLEISAILVHEPGSTPLGEKLTRLLKWGRATNISPAGELMLFNAARAQLVTEKIKPALESGKVVVCDRFADSTTVYQGYGRGLDIQGIKTINNIATGGLKPDLTILLDISVEEGFARKSGQEHDRFEKEDKDFHQKIQKGYLKLAKEEPERWLIIDASLSEEKIQQIIWQKVSELLSKRAGK